MLGLRNLKEYKLFNEKSQLCVEKSTIDSTRISVGSNFTLKMVQRRLHTSTKLPAVSSPRLNTESCPNSFLIGNDGRDRDILSSRRNRRLESPPIAETYPVGKTTNAPAPSGSKTQAACNTPELYSKLKGTPQSSSERMKSYCQPSDSLLRQYTLMSYSSGPMVNSLYPNYNVSVPFLPPRYSAYSMQNNGGGQPGHIQVQDNKSQSSNYHGHSFPPFFNPRTASNMPHKEKVNNWIENIPVFEVESGVWTSNCYDSNYSINWEEIEFDNPPKDNSLSFVTHDELLYLQAKKFESLVRRFYRSDQELADSQRDVLLDNPTLTDHI